MIRNEVHCNVSLFVAELARVADHLPPEYQDDLHGAYERSDRWDEADNNAPRECADCSDDDVPVNFEGYCESCWDDCDLARHEVYEHWSVSSYLADKLEQYGEKVIRDLCGHDVWCRCTTGQAIMCDAVISEIGSEVLSNDG